MFSHFDTFSLTQGGSPYIPLLGSCANYNSSIRISDCNDLGHPVIDGDFNAMSIALEMTLGLTFPTIVRPTPVTVYGTRKAGTDLNNQAIHSSNQGCTLQRIRFFQFFISTLNAEFENVKGKT